MADLEYYMGVAFPVVSDLDMIYVLKGIIEEVMIENRVYYDDDYRADAVEVIYPVIAHIVFNTHFHYIRHDKKAII